MHVTFIEWRDTQVIAYCRELGGAATLDTSRRELREEIREIELNGGEVDDSDYLIGAYSHAPSGLNDDQIVAWFDSNA